MKKNCNVCKKSIKFVLDLGKHPCADTFLSTKKNAIKIKKYPLKVGYCTCHHLSSIYKISEHERYKKFNYSYTAGNSPVSTNHFKMIAKKISNNFIKPKKNKILEIASNDGTFLEQLKKLQPIKEVGIDPSDYMCELANKKGINTEILFFSKKTSNLIKKKYGLFDLIYGANVFNHIDDPYDFINGCKNILKPNGILILEFPDLDQLLEKISFDTIYHEHRNYYSKSSLLTIFKKMNINVIKFENLEYMSGSIRVYIKNSNYKNIKLKDKTKSENLRRFKNFELKIHLIKKKLLAFIESKKKQGKIIAGFGAARKGNTLLNFCKITAKDIKFILETSIHKIGKYTPSSAIPIIDENKKMKFQALIILPWNINKYLKNKIKKNWKVDLISLQDIVKDII